MVPSSGIVTWKSDEDLEQERLELLVGAVDLVDQQHRRRRVAASSACSSGRSQQELQEPNRLRRSRDARLRASASADARASGAGSPTRRRRWSTSMPLVALQADQPRAGASATDLGDLGLADARLALEEAAAGSA